MLYPSCKSLRAEAVRNQFKEVDENAISVKIHYTFENIKKHRKTFASLKNKINLPLHHNIQRLLVNIAKHTRIFNYTLKINCVPVYNGLFSFNFQLKGNNQNIGKLYFDYVNDRPTQLILKRKEFYILGNLFYSLNADDITLKHCNDFLQSVTIDEHENEDYRELVQREMKTVKNYNTKALKLFKDFEKFKLYDFSFARRMGADGTFNSAYYIEMKYLIGKDIKWCIETKGKYSKIRHINDFDTKNIIMSLYECDCIFTQKEIEEQLSELNYDDFYQVTKLLNY